MARELIEYYNPTTDGYGLEGFINWGNTSMEFMLIPLFLAVFYGLALYLASRNDYKFGGQLILISFLFLLLGMIAQAITPFNQLVMFVFILGIIVGVVLSFIESS